MSFSQSLISSTVVAGVTFCAAALPLVALNSDAVTVQVNDEPVFVGQFRDVAGPYVGIAMAVSLGVGAVHLATQGWRESGSKLSEAEDEITRLKQQLKEEVARVEAIQFSERKLETVGLSAFLDEAEPRASAPAQQIQPNPAQVARPRRQLAAATTMPAAQAFHGYAASTPNALQPSAPQPVEAEAQPLDDLMSQLKHVMTQVERLQGQGVNASANLV